MPYTYTRLGQGLQSQDNRPSGAPALEGLFSISVAEAGQGRIYAIRLLRYQAHLSWQYVAGGGKVFLGPTLCWVGVAGTISDFIEQDVILTAAGAAGEYQDFFIDHDYGDGKMVYHPQGAEINNDHQIGMVLKTGPDSANAIIMIRLTFEIDLDYRALRQSTIPSV